MLFSLDWLLELCPASREPERIAAALTARGLTVDGLAAAGADVVLDVDVPANRPDCLGHRGLAREIAAALDVPLAPAAPAPVSGAAAGMRVEIEDPALCPRYTARIVRGLRPGPSPDWVVRRLEACGLRSLGSVVDASNLVMLELGQPIHLFDLERLRGGGGATPLLRVRAARQGETLRTLDGVERRLVPGMPVIADAAGPVALAGVIGGADSEISPATRHVLVEAARFDPASVRWTARALGVATDASYRFERGVDVAGAPVAQALAARLLAELAGGAPDPGILDLHPVPAAERSLRLRPSTVERLLGFAPERGDVARALAALALEPRPEPDGALCVALPSWRADLEREVDLVEEVARHLGYDRIPVAPVGGGEPVGAAGAVEERARDRLAGLGFHETLGYAMIGEGEDERFVAPGSAPAPALANPIAEGLSRLRRSLLPGLLRALDGNLRRGLPDVRLFEVGRVFVPEGGRAAPAEPLRLGLAWSGSGEPRHWSRTERPVDLYDVAGVGEDLLRDLRGVADCDRCTDAELAAFHPGRSLRWLVRDGRCVAWGGALHPELQRAIGREVWLLEADLDALAVGQPVARHSPVPRVPAVTRDLSLLLSGDVPYATLLATLRTVAPPAPARFEAVDRYRGAPLADGETSLTVRVVLEPRERTLTDAETETYRSALVARLQDDLGIRVRT